MKSVLMGAVALGLASGVLAKGQDDAAEMEVGRKIAASLSTEARALCIFDNGAPSDAPFTVARKLKVAKGTYGGVKELLPEFAQQALQAQAHAVVDYNNSQRFGFWPWRLVRPVVTGTAIRWTTPPTKSCEAMGGVRLETILLTNRSPEALGRAGGAVQTEGQVEPAQQSASAVEATR